MQAERSDNSRRNAHIANAKCVCHPCDPLHRADLASDFLRRVVGIATRKLQ